MSTIATCGTVSHLDDSILCNWRGVRLHGSSSFGAADDRGSCESRRYPRFNEHVKLFRLRNDDYLVDGNRVRNSAGDLRLESHRIGQCAAPCTKLPICRVVVVYRGGRRDADDRRVEHVARGNPNDRALRDRHHRGAPVRQKAQSGSVKR
jgi:hypothetical protein